MNDELPEPLDHLKPSPAPRELRSQVLAAVERELARKAKPRWERALELGVAASLVLGIGLNAWQWTLEGGWQTRAETSATSVADRRDLVEAVASITDKATAEMLVDRLVSMRRGGLGSPRPATDDAQRSLKN